MTTDPRQSSASDATPPMTAAMPDEMPTDLPAEAAAVVEQQAAAEVAAAREEVRAKTGSFARQRTAPAEQDAVEHCSTCNVGVTLTELTTGAAVRIGTSTVCPDCIRLLPPGTQLRIAQLRALHGLPSQTFRVQFADNSRKVLNKVSLFSYTTSLHMLGHIRLLATQDIFDTSTLILQGTAADHALPAALGGTPGMPASAQDPTRVMVTPQQRRNRMLLGVAAGLGGLLVLIGLVMLGRSGDQPGGPAVSAPTVPVRSDYPQDPYQAWAQAKHALKQNDPLLLRIKGELRSAHAQQLGSLRSALMEGRLGDAKAQMDRLAPLPDDAAFDDLRADESELRALRKSLLTSPPPTPPAPASDPVSQPPRPEPPVTPQPVEPVASIPPVAPSTPVVTTPPPLVPVPAPAQTDPVAPTANKTPPEPTPATPPTPTPPAPTPDQPAVPTTTPASTAATITPLNLRADRAVARLNVYLPSDLVPPGLPTDIGEVIVTRDGAQRPELRIGFAPLDLTRGGVAFVLHPGVGRSSLSVIFTDSKGLTATGTVKVDSAAWLRGTVNLGDCVAKEGFDITQVRDVVFSDDNKQSLTRVMLAKACVVGGRPATVADLGLRERLLRMPPTDKLLWRLDTAAKARATVKKRSKLDVDSVRLLLGRDARALATIEQRLRTELGTRTEYPQKGRELNLRSATLDISGMAKQPVDLTTALGADTSSVVVLGAFGAEVQTGGDAATAWERFYQPTLAACERQGVVALVVLGPANDAAQAPMLDQIADLLATRYTSVPVLDLRKAPDAAGEALPLHLADALAELAGSVAAVAKQYRD